MNPAATKKLSNVLDHVSDAQVEGVNFRKRGPGAIKMWKEMAKREPGNDMKSQCAKVAAPKVERLLRKSAAACMLASRLGDQFDGLVTGAGPKGTWVRIFDPPAEGRIERGHEGLDVGDRVRVKLVHTDAERGFIDFQTMGHSRIAAATRR